MEIKLNNLCTKKINNINIKFTEKEITALIGSAISIKNDILNLICGLEKKLNGEVKCVGGNQTEVEFAEKQLDIERDIYFLRESYKDMLFNINIKEDIKYYLGEYDFNKLEELLKGFNLSVKILDSSYLDLSSSEIKKILLIIGLMSSREVLILENPNASLDNKSVQVLIKELKKLKRENKIILVTSYNTNFLLEVSDRVIVLNNKKVIKDGTKFEIFLDEKLLDKVDLDTPKVLEFVNKVKNLKNIKLGYRDNINDLIKEVYRHAR